MATIISAHSTIAPAAGRFSPTKFPFRAGSVLITLMLTGFLTGLVNAQTWTERTKMPQPVSNFGYAVLNDQAYVVAGYGTSGDTNYVQRYTPATDTWEQLAPLPARRSVLYCGIVNGKIHAMGGWEDLVYKGDHFIYDPPSNTWTTGLALPNCPIGQFAATVNNKIYVFGGWWGSYRNSVYVYTEDAAGTGSWTTGTNMPTARNHGTTAVYDNQIFVMAGEGGTGRLDVVERYNPATGTWTTGFAPLPEKRHWLGSSGCPVLGNGLIYVVNGTAIDIYNPTADLWESGTMPGAVYGSVSLMGGSIYAIGPEHTFALNTTRLIATVGTAEVYPGDAVSVNLDIQGAVNLYALQAACTVEPAVMQPQSATFGNFFDPAHRLIAANRVDAAAGTWLGAFSQCSPALPLSGNGNVATLIYQAMAPGTTAIGCDPLLSDRDGLDLPVSYSGASVTVLPFATIRGVVTYQGRRSHGAIVITATGPVTRTATTDSSGNFVLTGLKTGSYAIVADAPRYLPSGTSTTVTSGGALTLPATVLRGGDVNDDGAIDIGDATLVATNFGMAVPPADPRADINADNTVNIRDLAILSGNYGLTGCQGW